MIKTNLSTGKASSDSKIHSAEGRGEVQPIDLVLFSQPIDDVKGREGVMGQDPSVENFQPL
jgi:hypothetical protein